MPASIRENAISGCEAHEVRDDEGRRIVFCIGKPGQKRGRRDNHILYINRARVRDFGLVSYPK